MQLRTVRVLLFVVMALALGAAQVALAQVDWVWETLVVPSGAPGDWDSNAHRLGNVVFDGTTYHMFLMGGQTWLPWDSPWHVGHWTWNALTQDWDEDPDNPVLSPEPGQWDGYTIWDLAVLYEGGVFKMWYGAAAAYPGESRAGYATSPDGSTWTKDPGNPLPGLEPGAPGEWDALGVCPSAVLFDGLEYRMWFVARKDDTPPDWGTWRIGTATSTNGIDWTKHPDPVLVASLPWEGVNVYTPEVISYGGGYAMWYTGWAAQTAIGYAVSPDGIHWGRWPGNPVLTPRPGCTVVDSTAVIIDSGTVYGWFSNCGDIWHVTSPLEVVFFDAFETGDFAIWSSMVP